jgi:hypothetical protein
MMRTSGSRHWAPRCLLRVKWHFLTIPMVKFACRRGEHILNSGRSMTCVKMEKFLR